MNKKRGFTLIELLTVIAIIGILAAILIPVVGKVRESAYSSVCQSNLRQWHTALMMHTNDHNDRMVSVRYYDPDGNPLPPQQQFWSGRLALYMDMETSGGSGAWDRQSPAVHGTVGECPAVPWKDTSTYISYGANGPASNNGALLYENSTGTRVLYDLQPHDIVFADCGEDYDGRSFYLGENLARLAYRHNDRANTVTIGGSVQTYAPSDEVESDENAYLWRWDR